jgi:AcrR family transcriptional regulator
VRRTKEEAEETRTAIIEASLRLFATKGYSRTRLEDVAKEADISRGAIYWHFENKPSLYCASILEATSSYRQRLLEILASELPPLAKIRSLMVAWLTALEEDEAYRAVIEMTLTRTEFDEELQAGVGEWLTFVEQLEKAIVDLVREGIERGEIRADTDAALAGLALISYLNGIEETWFLQQYRFPVRDMAESFVEFIIGGIVKTEPSGATTSA